MPAKCLEKPASWLIDMGQYWEVTRAGGVLGFGWIENQLVKIENFQEKHPPADGFQHPR
jgi:hypothetical protein